MTNIGGQWQPFEARDDVFIICDSVLLKELFFFVVVFFSEVQLILVTWIPVTMARNVLGLRTEKPPPDTEGS